MRNKAFPDSGKALRFLEAICYLASQKIAVMLYTIIQHAHSGLRWVVLLLLLWTIWGAFQGRQKGAAFGDADRKRGLFAMISAHIQLLLGLILYFTSPLVKFESGVMAEKIARFYTVEHISMMLIAIVLITLGYTRANKKADDRAKFQTQLVFFLIALLLILAAIPWPFRDGLNGNWF